MQVKFVTAERKHSSASGAAFRRSRRAASQRFTDNSRQGQFRPDSLSDASAPWSTGFFERRRGPSSCRRAGGRRTLGPGHCTPLPRGHHGTGREFISRSTSTSAAPAVWRCCRSAPSDAAYYHFRIGNESKEKGKVFPYSLPSVGPGADPGVQAVSPQVT